MTSEGPYRVAKNEDGWVLRGPTLEHGVLCHDAEEAQEAAADLNAAYARGVADERARWEAAQRANDKEPRND